MRACDTACWYCLGDKVLSRRARNKRERRAAAVEIRGHLVSLPVEPAQTSDGPLPGEDFDG